ncbi:phage terminase large subunit [Congregibacter litoralis]|uniref:Phage uncharacterized protein (Putative large terminase), C-terminal domain protein n=1 Tax=Congregibacter litoralis KT71 TaxID=314285 RepID=A4ACV2_9GAMM|nr:phage terminase large subunit [Congregibacter litoralis]EAQ96143.1 phage uncharacterized protein (putative large terminase), C-terminal domain protein [Congregibacter litoralis KT71]
MGHQSEINAILRTNFDLFFQRGFAELHPGDKYQDNWHMQAITHALNGVVQGKTNRLIITLPPRYGKSLAASIALPAYVLGRDPTKRIITASYGQVLAEKLAMDCKRVMEAPFYRKAFPETKIGNGKNAMSNFSTTAGGSRYATSEGGSVTGMGADLIIVDDLMKASEIPTATTLDNAIEYLRSTLFSRLNDKVNGQIVIVMQRLHEDDPVGQLTRLEGWDVLNLPAIAEHDEDVEIGPGRFYHRRKGEALHEAREPLKTLLQIKEEIGPRNFGAQYQQQPVPAGGGIVEWDWFRPYEELPNNGKGGFIVQSWDTAMVISDSSSYTVCTTWFCDALGNYYLIHVWRHRRSSSDLPAIVHRHAIEHEADLVIIEMNNGSRALIETLFIHTKLTVTTGEPRGSKAERMEAESPVVAAGRVFVPISAPWLEAFRAEIVKFPEARHDDQVDSLSQFLYWARKHGPDYPGGKPGLGRPDGPVGEPPQKVGNASSGSRFIGCGTRHRSISLRGIDIDNFRL